jgi:hypothetical protein
LYSSIRFFYIFLIILQNYTTVSKFIRFDNQPPWATAATVATVVRSNRRSPRRLGQRLRAPTGV